MITFKDLILIEEESRSALSRLGVLLESEESAIEQLVVIFRTAILTTLKAPLFQILQLLVKLYIKTPASDDELHQKLFDLSKQQLPLFRSFKDEEIFFLTKNVHFSVKGDLKKAKSKKEVQFKLNGLKATRKNFETLVTLAILDAMSSKTQYLWNNFSSTLQKFLMAKIFFH